MLTRVHSGAPSTPATRTIATLQRSSRSCCTLICGSVAHASKGERNQGPDLAQAFKDSTRKLYEAFRTERLLVQRASAALSATQRDKIMRELQGI